jgi:hypothetical protein
MVGAACFPSEALALVLPEGDEAPVAPPSDEVELAASEYPSGGLITGWLNCFSDCMASLQFQDAEGNILTGTFITLPEGSPFGFAWQADTALLPGTYQASLPGMYSTDVAPFIVVEASEELPSVASALSPYDQGGGEPVVCVEPVPGILSQFHETTETVPFLGLTVEGPNTSQYIYVVSLNEGEAMPFTQITSHSSVLAADATEVCFEVFAVPVIGGDEVSIGSECLPTNSIGGLGEREEIYGTVESTLSTCVVPPAGYEEEWCTYFSPASVDHSCDGYYAEACEAARAECSDGDGGSEVIDQEERANNENGDDKNSPPDQSGSCSTSHVGSEHNPLLFGLLFGFVGVTISRRRRIQRCG